MALLSLIVLHCVTCFQGSSVKPQPQGQEDAILQEELPEGAFARLGTSLLRPGAAIYGLALSPDGHALATISSESLLQVWDIRTGKALFKRSASGGYGENPVFSGDGQCITTGGFEGVQWWDISTGRQAGPAVGPEGPVHRIDVSADGTLVACASEDKGNPLVRVWNRLTGKELLRVPGEADYGYPLALTRDGSLLSVGTLEGSIALYDVDGGKEVRRFKAHKGGVRSLAFSPKGDLLASGSNDKTAGVWDVKGGALLHRLRGHTAFVPSVSFSSDGSRLATGGHDASVRLWDVASGKERLRVDQPSLVEAVVFSRDGRKLFTGNWDGGIHVWDADSGEELTKRPGPNGAIYAIASTGDGSTLASAGSDRIIRVWDVALQKERVALKGHTGAVRSLSFSPGGDLIASGAEDQSVKVWRLPQGELKFTLRGTQNFDFVHGVSFSPDGGDVAAASSKAVRVWKASVGDLKNTLRETFENGPARFSAVAFSSDGRWLAWGAPGTLEIRDLKEDKEPLRVAASQRSVDCMAFSPSSAILASAGSDRTIRWWNPDKGIELWHSEPFDSVVGALAFSPSGSFLAAGLQSGVLRLFESWSGGEIRKWEGRSGSVHSLSFTDDQTLASGTANATIVLWKVAGIGAPALPERPVDMENEWRELASRDCSRAYEALRRLVSAPGQALPLLEERARPISHEAIRLYAGRLDDEDVEARTSAVRALELAAGEIQSPLEKVLGDSPSVEVRGRVSLLLNALKPPLIRSPGRLRMARTVQGLEWMGTPEARLLLEDIAKAWGPSFESDLARAALARLTSHKKQ